MHPKKLPVRRVAVMVLGILIMGLGVALFKLSLMGNDPNSAMVMAAADRLGVDFSVALIVENSVVFIAELLLGRKYIGLGTFVNWFGVGPLTTLYLGLIHACWQVPQTILARLMLMMAGVLVLSLSASLYQTANLGIAPYDAVSIIMEERLPLPYFWCRILTDSVCAAAALLLGGIVGLGTLVCALGLGPFIAFFNRHISQKLCGGTTIKE